MVSLLIEIEQVPGRKRSEQYPREKSDEDERGTASGSLRFPPQVITIRSPERRRLPSVVIRRELRFCIGHERFLYAVACWGRHSVCFCSHNSEKGEWTRRIEGLRGTGSRRIPALLSCCYDEKNVSRLFLQLQIFCRLPGVLSRTCR